MRAISNPLRCINFNPHIFSRNTPHYLCDILAVQSSKIKRGKWTYRLATFQYRLKSHLRIMENEISKLNPSFKHARNTTWFEAQWENKCWGWYRPSEKFWILVQSILFFYLPFTDTKEKTTTKISTHLPVPSSVNRKTTCLNWSQLGKSAQINSKH